MTQIKFTADLLALMARQNLCETQAAGLLGVPVFTLKKWTSAQRAPSASAVRLLEVLGLLDQLAKERALLVVTHEPELFAGRISEAWQLVDGCLVPLVPTRLLTMTADGSS